MSFQEGRRDSLASGKEVGSTALDKGNRFHEMSGRLAAGNRNWGKHCFCFSWGLGIKASASCSLDLHLTREPYPKTISAISTEGPEKATQEQPVPGKPWVRREWVAIRM